MRKVTARKSRKKQPLWIRILIYMKDILFYLPVAVCVVLLICAIIFYQSGYYAKAEVLAYNAFYKSSVKSGLVVGNILLEGQHYTPKEDIISVITKSEDGHSLVRIGEPILVLDLTEAKKRLESLTWVSYASVDRQYPSTLSVRIEERRPTALWQYKGKVNLIGNDGKIIEEKDLTKFSNLIIMVGKDVPAYAESLLKMIENEERLKERVSSAIRVGERRWNIRLDNGIEIRLPEENPEKAWEALAKKQEDTKILDSNISRIDLRIAERMVVR